MVWSILDGVGAYPVDKSRASLDDDPVKPWLWLYGEARMARDNVPWRY